MSDTIIVAIISFLGTLAGSLSGMNIMSFRIKQLEKRVDKHNNFAERMPVLEEKIKVINHRVEDLENTERE